MPDSTPLFSTEFLTDRLSAYDLSAVVNISGIKREIKKLNESLESGKFDLMKEEAIKSQFLTSFFGNILGFSYKNSHQWLFQEEVKTDADGTKPDGALGAFYITENGIKKDVRVVIEVKSAGTDLDAVQKDRTVKISPVDQAMLYATKMGGSCRWVVVTNIRELRFYHANDQTRYQKFLLSELVREDRLRELLFLFLRENFYTGQESSTEGLMRLLQKERYLQPAASHILDQLYFSLEKFDQLYFIDPKLIANMKPFNILDGYVWHYVDGHLFSLNAAICEFINNISINEGELSIEPGYEVKLQNAEVVEYRKKIEYIIEKLATSQINHFSAIRDFEQEKKRNKNVMGYSYRHIPHLTPENSVTLKIKLNVDAPCNCLACTYHALDFVKFVQRIEQLEEDPEANQLELAYGHYQLCTDNFRQSYQIYKSIERETKGDEKRILEYFRAKYNIKHLLNLFFDDTRYAAMRKDARSIDLDRVISDELDIFIDKDVRKLLLEIKEDKLFNKAIKRSEELVGELERVRSFITDGGTYSSLPNYARQLNYEFAQVFSQVQKNYLIYDRFTDYRHFIAMVFRGFLTSSRTNKHGVKNISVFLLTEAVLYIPPKELQVMLKPFKSLKVKSEDRLTFLNRGTTFFSSYTNKGIFGDPYINSVIEKLLLNPRFQDKFTDIFSNLCSMLGALEYTRAEFSNTATALIKFIRVDGVLAWWEVEQLGKLIEHQSVLFSEKQLMDILKFSLDNHRLNNNKYEALIHQVTSSIRKYYPECRFDNLHIAKRAILNCESENGGRSLNLLSGLWHIATDEIKGLLSDAFENELDHHFNDHLYEHLVKSEVIRYDCKDYFSKLAILVDRQKGQGLTGFEGSTPLFSDFVLYNFLLIPYLLNLDFDLPELKLLTGLSPFEIWLADPFNFDYADFDPKWLIAANSTAILRRLQGFQPIAGKLKTFLKQGYQKELSETYIKYFA